MTRKSRPTRACPMCKYHKYLGNNEGRESVAVTRAKQGGLFDGWDDIVPTAECRHCNGTGRAPGDGRTECGFCR